MKKTLLTALTLAAALLIPACKQDTENMRNQAASFVSGMGYEIQGTPQCQDYDSDGDKYVSCTVAVKGQGPLAIECKSDYALGSGCRMQKLGVGNLR